MFQASQGGVKGYQYDLFYIRRDSVLSLVEVKYQQKPVETTVIREMEEKISKTKFPRGVTLEKILICNQEPSNAVIQSGYFHHILTGEEIVR